MTRTRSILVTTLALFLLCSITSAENPEDLLLQGEMAFYEGDEKAALEYWTKFVEVAPDRWEGHYYVGMLHHLRDEPETAIECYLKALEIKPDSTEALNNLALLYIDAGKLDEAVTLASKSIDADSENYEAFSTWGAALEAKEQPEEALKIYARWAEASPGDPDPLIAAAELFLTLEQPEQAALALAKGFGRAPHDLELGLTALELLEKTDQDEAALKLARKLAKRLAKKSSKQTEAVFRVARTLRRLGQIDEALALFHSLPAEVRASFSVTTEIGLIHLGLGDCKSAAKAFDEALEAKPDDPTALLARADAFCCAGKWCKAKKGYKAVVAKVDPDDPVVKQAKIKLAQGKKGCKK